jgi:UDP-GlcNAc3NAcA epimerase
MLKIVTIIGARPQIIKAAALSRAIATRFSAELKEVIVHTGQHYDANMSQVFFDELDIPKPDYNLNVGSGAHGKQTASMIEGIEEILLKEKPSCIVLYGDTNSTLAGAVAASKIHVPVVHIEAGLRSFNKSMPEEVNRIMCDHVSTLLFSPTATGVKNLQKEGFSSSSKPPYTIDNPKVYHSGDVMYDNSLHFSTLADKSDIIERYSLEKDNFILATIHRNSNTDNSTRLNAIFRSLLRMADANIPVILPIHPRTEKMLDQQLDPELLRSVIVNLNIALIPPVPFLEMIALEKNAKMIVTDSGGVQKEAYFVRKPCIVLRPETEWVELAEVGAAILADADENKIMEAFARFSNSNKITYELLYGDGKAAEFICQEIISNFKS